MGDLDELNLLCTYSRNMYLCVYLCPVFVLKLTCVYRDRGEESRTLICTLLVLEVMRVEKYVGSGPVVVLVLKNTNRF